MKPLHFGAPVRVTITLPWVTYEELINKSQLEGRSISNLAAYLLESSLSGRSLLPPQHKLAQRTH